MWIGEDEERGRVAAGEAGIAVVVFEFDSGGDAGGIVQLAG